jgi:hypothetical protein
MDPIAQIFEVLGRESFLNANSISIHFLDLDLKDFIYFAK